MISEVMLNSDKGPNDSWKRDQTAFETASLFE